ncbi:stage II sporulation protein R [Marinisporobacter balticus]|uniref:Stage II sporulation protein R n=1 Tax=Marinisporobacter balticus TaxID=2018667 RepID=A0A4V2SCB3_9FIRM|nr:stage II sporulation protein R [Marinisporobacter balticus]TCO78740.1 stage II sporulation protein R [Marinisporobacter balticus]
MEKFLKNICVHKAKMNFVIGIILITFITVGFYFFTHDVYENQKSYKKQMIRFHVLANSDSPQDQALKLKVRDRIIEEMNPKFEGSKSLDQTRGIIKRNIKNIEVIAMDTIKEDNRDYEVKATLAEVDFPTKNYGSITLPAGNYEALRVVIGKGEGANWWCVLFPPLCFIDTKNGLTNEKTKKEMMNVLTEEEFKMISTAKSEDRIPIKLKFKTVEILEEAKLKLNKVVGMK